MHIIESSVIINLFPIHCNPQVIVPAQLHSQQNASTAIPFSIVTNSRRVLLSPCSATELLLLPRRFRSPSLLECTNCALVPTPCEQSSCSRVFTNFETTQHVGQSIPVQSTFRICFSHSRPRKTFPTSLTQANTYLFFSSFTRCTSYEQLLLQAAVVVIRLRIWACSVSTCILVNNT